MRPTGDAGTTRRHHSWRLGTLLAAGSLLLASSWRQAQSQTTRRVPRLAGQRALAAPQPGPVTAGAALVVLGRGTPKRGSTGDEAAKTAHQAARNDAYVRWGAIQGGVRVTPQPAGGPTVRQEGTVLAGTLVEELTPELRARGVPELGWDPQAGIWTLAMLVPREGPPLPEPAPGAAHLRQQVNGALVDWASAWAFLTAEGGGKAGTEGGQRQMTARLAAYNNAVAGVAALAGALAGGAAPQGATVRAGIGFEDARQLPMPALGFTELGWQAERGVYRLVMAVPLYGSRENPGGFALERRLQAAPAADPPDLRPVERPGARRIPQGEVTGLVIDCGDAPLAPDLVPRILNAQTRQEVYGPTTVALDAAIPRGMVGHAPSLDAALQMVDRVGASPMVLPAAAVDGPGCVAVSPEDAARIVDADGRRGVLKECRVVLVVARVPRKGR